MRSTHVVKQGEHLAAIAAFYGFSTIDPIWKDPANEAISRARDPHQLLPGDVLVIPETSEDKYVRRVNQTHRFVVELEKVRLRISVESFDRTYQIDQATANLKVGTITKDVPVADADIVLERRDLLATLNNDEFELSLRIGGLDPADSDSGVEMRLINLGYMQVADDDDERGLAVEEFQLDNDLPATGVVDDATRDALVDAHGA